MCRNGEESQGTLLHISARQEWTSVHKDCDGGWESEQGRVGGNGLLKVEGSISRQVEKNVRYSHLTTSDFRTCCFQRSIIH